MGRVESALEVKFTRKPSPHAILEAFPEEAKELVPKALKALRRELKPYYDRREMILGINDDDEFRDFLMLLERNIYMPAKKKMDHLAQTKLLGRLMCKTTRGITDDYIAEAKQKKIADMHTFRAMKPMKRGFSAICPFHTEDSASFYVRDNKFRCFGCGVYGDAIDFYSKINNLQFYQAVNEMIKK